MSRPTISDAVIFINGPWANQSKPLDKSYKPGYMLKVILPPPPAIAVTGGTLPPVDLGFRVGHYEMVWHGSGLYVQRYGIWRGPKN